MSLNVSCVSFVGVCWFLVGCEAVGLSKVADTTGTPYTILEGSNGVLHVVTRSQEYSRYLYLQCDPGTSTCDTNFYYTQFGYKVEYWFPTAPSLMSHADGTLYASYLRGKEFRVDRLRPKSHDFQVLVNLPSQADPEAVVSCFPDKSGHLYLALPEEVVMLKNHSVVRIRDSPPRVSRVVTDSQGNLYMWAAGRGAVHVLPVAETRLRSPAARRVHGVESVVEATLHQENIFFATTSGVRMVSGLDNVTTFLSGRRVNLMAVDFSGNLICATDNKVFLVRLPGGYAEDILTVFSPSVVHFTRILILPNDYIYLATNESSIYVLDPLRQWYKVIGVPTGQEIQEVLAIGNQMVAVSEDLFYVSQGRALKIKGVPSGKKTGVSVGTAAFVSAFEGLFRVDGFATEPEKLVSPPPIHHV